MYFGVEFHCCEVESVISPNSRYTDIMWYLNLLNVKQPMESYCTLPALQFGLHQQHAHCRYGTWTLLGSVGERRVNFLFFLFFFFKNKQYTSSLQQLEANVYLRPIGLLLPDGNLISQNGSVVLNHHRLFFNVSRSKQPQALRDTNVDVNSKRISVTESEFRNK